MAAVTLSLDLVVRATGGHLVTGPLSRVFTGVSTDTRTLQPGAIFFALQGDRYDGTAFIGAAVAAGATGVVVAGGGTHGVVSLDGVAVIETANTIGALQSLARTIRRESSAKVVAITGSAGKTTTKEMTADLLSARHDVLRNKGNFNNHIGLPLSLVELCRGQDVAVVELGMNHEGEIRTLVGIAEPDVRVWTNVGDAHIGHFGSREAVARAKAEILEHGRDAVVVANADDDLVVSHVERFTGRRVWFGERDDAEVRATQVVDRGFDGMTANVTTPAGLLHLTIRLPGRALLGNVLAAVAVAIQFDISLTEIEARVGAFAPMARRGRVTTLASGTRVADDSYNASPAAVRAMLAALASTDTHGRRVAVLGEMLELGASSRRLHEACGAAVAASRVDALVVVGGADADGLVDGAISAGFSRERIHRFADSLAAADAVVGLVAPGDLVLVKGSRGTRTDIIADRLMEAA